MIKQTDIVSRCNNRINKQLFSGVVSDYIKIIRENALNGHPSYLPREFARLRIFKKELGNRMPQFDKNKLFREGKVEYATNPHTSIGEHMEIELESSLLNTKGMKFYPSDKFKSDLTKRINKGYQYQLKK